MNYETNLYRVCQQFGAPIPPNDTPITSPHNPVDIQNMCKNIGRWTYLFSGYKTPYHLVEGYTRLAWIHYYANHPDNSLGVKLSNKHSVWLITMKN
ncbi:TPA: hypothetical protein ROX87_005236 [Bacillus thuringiensis]|uniref:hypothetical protein n=1 Tax=Bacillus cereus group TaxID=86661 RepID=UPI000BF815FA|nr:hypothetical protein [Bacillus thuringiensis]MED3358838.1 hypothetical protein [Bacillus thuringiensis]PER42405.1 hypothetical protein CN472_26745 [Bacillus thuringiensis]PWN14141.1 hypothetical protein CU072_18505 [Bacillus thuringiensis]HDX9535740.1 hypothetical protein [Bacillus thuringiensis]